MNKQPELTAQTKQNLTDAFWQLYCTKRIDKITVKAITLLAGYNRGTFYEYFTDIYDVLEQIENSLLPASHELPPLDFSAGASPFSTDIFVKMYTDHSKYYVVLFGDNGDPSFQSKMKNRLKPMIKKKLISQGIADDFELDYTLEFTLSAMIGVLSYWFKQEKKLPIENLIKLIYNFMQNGIIKKLLHGSAVTWKRLTTSGPRIIITLNCFNRVIVGREGGGDPMDGSSIGDSSHIGIGHSLAARGRLRLQG